ncbi:MAG: leucine-rich repeat domain-containing protein [Muribaculaceae bacterium]|nr:leucine-rich repeat domain-containing protein [Muribaculaceae bacterium]
MKRYLIILTVILIGLTAPFHTGALTVEPKYPGSLHTLIAAPEKVTALSVIGPIDASDIYYISSAMTMLHQLDLSNATVSEYSGKPLSPAHTGIHQQNAIPPYAFMECQATELSLPSTTRRIGYAAFAGSQLTSLDLPDGLTEVEAYAFQSSALKSVTLPPSLAVIGESAFQKCTSLESVTASRSLTAIGSKAFEGTALTTLDLSECSALRQIGPWAFSGMKQLATVILPSGITEIGHGAFMNDRSLTQIVMSDQLGKLPALMLYGTESLTSVKIPAAVDSIGSFAMGDMASLTSLDASSPRSVPGLETNVWGGTPVTNVRLYVPERLVNYYSTAEQWRDFIIEGVSGIDLINADTTSDITITRNGDMLHVESDSHLKSVRLIDCSGKVLAELRPDAQSCDINIDTLPHSVCIVQCTTTGGVVSATKVSI